MAAIPKWCIFIILILTKWLLSFLLRCFVVVHLSFVSTSIYWSSVYCARQLEDQVWIFEELASLVVGDGNIKERCTPDDKCWNRSAVCAKGYGPSQRVRWTVWLRVFKEQTQYAFLHSDKESWIMAFGKEVRSKESKEESESTDGGKKRKVERKESA